MQTLIHIFAIASLVTIGVVTFKACCSDKFMTPIFILVTIAGFILCNLVFIGGVAPFFGGIDPDYRKGVTGGVYITTVYKNNRYQSYEAVGLVGDQGKNYITVRFSTKNPDFGEILKSKIGKTVDIQFRNWKLHPYFSGESKILL